ncbi:MAG: hypothetical protein H0T42_13415 [Deltaproteobacteria bacterium]|nr:hypothetical protein [Deltaproteobacteria bacterium]
MGASVRRLSWLCAALAFAPTAGADRRGRTKVTVWASSPGTASYGGLTYGGYAPTTGAMITEHREITVGGNEVRLAGVAATLDPASIQLRDLTDPASTITEQRFVAAATTPTEIMHRHVGDSITVVTSKGEVSGILRSIDEQALVLEVGTGDQRRLQVMRRDGYVQDVRLPPGTGVDKPSLVWRIASKKPGKHDVELTYRADGMSWTADYLAVLDEAGTSMDFSAWATVRNATGATFDNAELTLVSGGNAGPLSLTFNPYGGPTRTASAAAVPVRYPIATPVRLGAGQSVQVELLPAKQKAKSRPVITYEAMPDPSPGFQAYPNTDCNQFNGVGMGTGRAELAVELEVATKDALPEGRVRTFRRKGDRLEVVSEDQLRSSAGLARIRLVPDADIVGERKAVACTYDERAHTVVEKIEVKIQNNSRRTAEVVVREFAWRWPVWRLEAEDSKSGRSGAQTLEYRAKVPAHGKKTVTYSVVYTW